jgi:hypothetical protein
MTVTGDDATGFTPRPAIAPRAAGCAISEPPDVVRARLRELSIVFLRPDPHLRAYVPKSWRRAALVAGPLSLLPFATLGVLALRHPAAMACLRRGGDPAQPRWPSSSPSTG